MHGGHRRGDEDRPLGPPVADRRGPRLDGQHARQRQRDRPARDHRAGPRQGADHQRRADGTQGRGRQHRSCATRSPTQNPVANLFGKVAADQPRREARSRSPTSGSSSAASTRMPRSATRRSTPTPSTSCSTAAGSSSPTPAATRSTPSIRGATSRTSRCSPTAWSPTRSTRRRRTIPMQAVPTSVEEGPDRQYYVGQLTGFPFPVGGANVYRVNPRTGDQTVVARGFTNIMDLAFGRDGTLYVLEIDHDGLLTPDQRRRDLRDPAPRRDAPDQAARRDAAVPRRPGGRGRRPVRLGQRALAGRRAGR